jgi:alkaline phosphatase
LHQLPLDTIMVGQSRTRSSDSWVTDSAAGATAFSCADKSYNGAIAVNATKAPCATVLEAAKLSGYHTGLVVTSRITHATPAAFSSHVTFRDFEAEIAVQQIGDYPFGRVVDLMFGGGRRFFLPTAAEKKTERRTDGRDLLKEAREKFGFNSVVQDRSGFDAMPSDKSALPAIGLFAEDHMAYSIDHNPSTEPSLTEMTAKALSILTDATKDSEKGFFMLIEGPF